MRAEERILDRAESRLMDRMRLLHNMRVLHSAYHTLNMHFSKTIVLLKVKRFSGIPLFDMISCVLSFTRYTKEFKDLESGKAGYICVQ
jgi:hypothetical protein